MRDIENLRRLRREWYHRNREEESKKQVIRKRARVATIKAFLDEIKTSNPCMDCKEFYPACVMDFDHLRDKKFSIAKHDGSKSLETIKTELAKCELVCANCHRIRTHNRRNVV